MPSQFLKRPAYTWAIIALITLFAFALRLHVATIAREDYDEDDYLMAARVFREHINAGEWGDIPNVESVAEHPPLVKLLYSFTLDNSELDDIPEDLPRGSRRELPENSLQNARWQSVSAGTLTVFALALVNPVAAILLSFQSIHVQFSSLAYLDALPTLLVGLMGILYGRVLAIEKEKRLQSRTDNLAFLLSAVCFGIAVAAKYPYAIVGHQCRCPCSDISGCSLTVDCRVGSSVFADILHFQSLHMDESR